MALTLSRRKFLASSTALLSASCFPPAWTRAAPSSLPITALLDGTDGKLIDLQIRSGEWSFTRGVKTLTLGFNQNYLDQRFELGRTASSTCITKIL